MFIIMKHLVSVLILSAASVVVAPDLVDQVFGEALLNSLNSSLREKLQEIHDSGVLKNLSETQMAHVVKAQLTPDEVKELEVAYKRLILPMLQDTLEKRLGRRYENLDDIPIELGSDEDEDDDGVDDFKTESEELAERKIREKQSNDKNKRDGDSRRTVGAENGGELADDKGSAAAEKRKETINDNTGDKSKTGETEKKARRNKAKEEL